MLAVAIILHRYAMRFGLWEKRWSWFPTLRIDKAKTMLVGLIAGSIMTISRGPWLATIVGLIIAFVGTAQNRWRAARLAVIVLVVGGGLVYLGGKSYVSNSQGDKESQEELASAEYRTRLMDEYSDIASQQKLWGWGSTYWPRVPGMASIDNWYLLLMLMYGITGLVLFVLMLVASVARLLWAGLLDNTLTLDQRGMIFTLAGIVIAVAVAVATVFLGGQVFPALFLFLGWSDACLVYRPKRAPVVVSAAAPAFAFRRVIA
jgi:O-antigen ligase